jgi:hypothetical protein
MDGMSRRTMTVQKRLPELQGSRAKTFDACHRGKRIQAGYSADYSGSVLRIKSPASSCGHATVRSGPTISDHAESRWSSTASEQHLQGRSGFRWQGGQPYGQLKDCGHVDSLIAVRR